MNRASTSYFHILRGFNRDVRLYLITTMLIGLTVDGGIYTVLFNLYLLRLGYGPEFVGLINGAGMLVFALICLPAGTFGGRWGNRRMMIVGLSLLVIGCGLLPFAESRAENWQAGWLFIIWCLAFTGFAMYFVNTAPFAMKIAHQRERSHVFSVQAALWSLAGFAGSLVGGFLPSIFAIYLGVSLDQAAPYRYSLLAASLLLIPSVLAIAATREGPTQPIKERPVKGEASPVRLIAFLTLIRLLVVTGVGTLFTFFNVYMDAGLHISTVHIGVLSAIGRLLSIPTALIVPLLTARWGNGHTAAWASLGTAIGMLPLILISHWSAAGLGFIGVLALTSIRYPAFLVYTMEVVSPARRGTMSGAGEMASGLSFSAMALGGGYIIKAFGYRSFFLTGASLTVIGTLSFLIHLRLQRRQSAG